MFGGVRVVRGGYQAIQGYKKNLSHQHHCTRTPLQERHPCSTAAAEVDTGAEVDACRRVVAAVDGAQNHKPTYPMKPTKAPEPMTKPHVLEEIPQKPP